MGRLDKYAREQKRAIRNQTVSTKLSEEEYKRFIKYVGDRNLGKSEALYLLILEEIGDNTKEELRTTKEDYKKTGVIKSSQTPSKRRRTGRQSEIIERWRINKKLPCVFCSTWSSANHFAGRHAKRHGYMTTEEYLQANENAVKIMHEQSTKKNN